MSAALSNAVYAMPSGPFMLSLSASVSNSGELDSGATWLLGLVDRYLEGKGLAHGPLPAYDHCIWDVEALDRFWPAIHASEAVYRNQGFLEGEASPAPALARYLAERLPAIWDRQSWDTFPPLTRALRISARVDELVGFFGIGIKPTGSKDPHALRRAAIQLLQDILFPIMRTGIPTPT